MNQLMTTLEGQKDRRIILPSIQNSFKFHCGMQAIPSLENSIIQSFFFWFDKLVKSSIEQQLYLARQTISYQKAKQTIWLFDSHQKWETLLGCEHIYNKN
jgi:hypothetical protein